jgi:hypothetical protein
MLALEKWMPNAENHAFNMSTGIAEVARMPNLVKRESCFLVQNQCEVPPFLRKALNDMISTSI